MEPDRSSVPIAGGVITALRSQKRDPGRVSVDIDGSYAFGISADVALSEGLRVGSRLTAADAQRIRSAESARAANDMALAFLSRRERTTEEVRRKLGASFDDAVTSAVITRLLDLGYLNDEAYAARYASVRLERGYGPRRIAQELRRRGLPAEVVSTALSLTGDEDDLRAQAFAVARRRFARLHDADEMKRKKKLYDYLIRRGYPHEIARAAIEAVLAP